MRFYVGKLKVIFGTYPAKCLRFGITIYYEAKMVDFLFARWGLTLWWRG